MADYQQLSLRQSAQFDFQNKLKDKVTAWGLICRLRRENGTSRKQRRLKKEKASQ